MTHHTGSRIEAFSGFAVEALRETGNEAQHYYGKGVKKFDENLVTKAELRISNRFQRLLEKKYPEHLIFRNKHQKKNYAHDDKRYLWIFDAIDGVDNYQAGIPIWGMSLALLENFWPVFGAFYMPATGDLFHARADGEAFWNGNRIRIPENDTINDESVMFTFSRFHQKFTSNFQGKLRNLGCTGAHICYVAMGRGDAVITANESFQDLAATRVIVEAAGGKLFKVNGDNFYLNDYIEGDRIEENLVVTSKANCRAVLDSIQRSNT